MGYLKHFLLPLRQPAPGSVDGAINYENHSPQGKVRGGTISVGRVKWRSMSRLRCSPPQPIKKAHRGLGPQQAGMVSRYAFDEAARVSRNKGRPSRVCNSTNEQGELPGNYAA